MIRVSRLTTDATTEIVMDSAPGIAYAAGGAPEGSAPQIVAKPHRAANDRAAQNEPGPELRIEPEEAHDFRNPLWAVAIGTALLFAVMAAVMTVS